MTVPFSDNDRNWPTDEERQALLDVFDDDVEWARTAPRQEIVLSAEDYDKLQAMLDDPPQDTSKLRELFQRPCRIFKDT